MDLDATPYRVFVTVADQMSFVRASQLLNVSQPALSAGIRELERRQVPKVTPKATFRGIHRTSQVKQVPDFAIEA
jgi:DNA-binding transcriptional LysR family regulator